MTEVTPVSYNVLHIINALAPVERDRLKLIVVRPWELVYRIDPPGGHMDGPRALLTSLH